MRSLHFTNDLTTSKKGFQGLNVDVPCTYYLLHESQLQDLLIRIPIVSIQQGDYKFKQQESFNNVLLKLSTFS